jgi:hypothetical protein
MKIRVLHLLTEFKCRSSNRLIGVLRLLDDVDYFVVMVCYYINYYVCYLCMFGIGG